MLSATNRFEMLRRLWEGDGAMKDGPYFEEVSHWEHDFKMHISLDATTSYYPSLFPGHYEVSNSVPLECSICLTTGPETRAALAYGLKP